MVYTPEQKKEARRIARKKWRDKNTDRVNARRREHRAEDPSVLQRDREYNARQREFGLSIEDYERMFEQQEGVCAICRQPRYAKYGHLHADHDHNTGKVRGLLCGSCNRGIGLLQDNPAYALSAARYLAAHAERV